MNRTTVLILALVLFLAHVLALHHDQAGAFALPSDLAHVDFQIARNLVHGQGSTWWPGGSPAAILEEGGTSLVWVLLIAMAELLTWSPVRTTATVGILAALLAVAFTARLSRDRLVGITATVLLVISGPLAASAADGTETGFFTMLVALSFLALERRRSDWLGPTLAVLVLTSSLGTVLALGFLVAAVHSNRCEGRRVHLKRAFLPPLVAGLAVAAGRTVHGAPALTPDLQLLLAADPDQVRLGLASLESLVRGTLAPVLVLLPLLQLVRGNLSGTGRRALGLGLLAVALVVLTGASERPMHAAFVPALPLLYLAVQEAVVGSLDRRPAMEWLVWTGLGLAGLGSVMASKLPGDLGPVHTEPVLEAMARNHPMVTEAWGVESSGRLHLMDDLRASDRLRAIGIFLRDQAAVDARILSPWPGAIGYLSRRRVVDLLGRVEPTAGHPAQSWRGRTRADLVEVLAERPEYVVPVIADLRRPPTLDELVDGWLERYDTGPPTPARRAALVDALAPYELVAVPIPEREQELTLPSASPGYLLRLRELGLGPHLELATEGAWIEVIVEHPGHHQIAELEVRVDGPNGSSLYLRPSGAYTANPALARTETLLFPTGDRRVELVRAQLPVALLEDGLPPAGLTVTARLLNPFSDPSDPLSPACVPVTHSY